MREIDPGPNARKAPDKEKKSGRILTRTCCAKEACRKARFFRSGIRANGIGEERAGQSIVKGKKGKITALPDLLNVKKRPKSSAIRNIAYIERHKICPGGRLFRIWDENSHCYCTGIIYQEKKSRLSSPQQAAWGSPVLYNGSPEGRKKGEEAASPACKKVRIRQRGG